MKLNQEIKVEDFFYLKKIEDNIVEYSIMDKELNITLNNRTLVSNCNEDNNNLVHIYENKSNSKEAIEVKFNFCKLNEDIYKIDFLLSEHFFSYIEDVN